MINTLKRLVSAIKSRKKVFIFLAVLALGGVSWTYFSEDETGQGTIAVAERGPIIQEVSVTGKVKSARSVELAFERGGKVNYVGVKSGDKVPGGRLLALIDDSELKAQEQREKANISAAESRLNQIIASSNNPNGDASAVADLLSKSLKTVIDSMIDFTDVQYKYFSDNRGPSVTLAQKKDEILHAVYGESNLGRAGFWYFTSLNSGLKLETNNFKENPNDDYSDSLLASMESVLLKTKTLLELMQTEMGSVQNASDTDKNLINADIDLVLAQLSNISGQKKVIVGDEYDIEIAKSQVEQAKASLALVQAQIAKYRLVSPFSGTVANIDVKVSQLVSPNISVISLIGDAKFQIEANISEADIAKISIGDTADVTLDAYGSGEIFTAKVVHIDPAGRNVDGVTSYKVTLEFDNEDERILSGLTADMDILTDERENVLSIPSRNIITRDGKKYVRVLVSNGMVDDRFANLAAVTQTGKESVFEVEIKTGLRGSDGRMEILSGLREGDIVVRE